MQAHSARNRTQRARTSEGSMPDRRLAKTRNALAQAMFQLMQEKDWDAIAVQDICDAADVARSSFYAHFDSKVALLDHMIARSLATALAQRKSGNEPLALLVWVIDHVTENRGLFQRTSRKGGAQTVTMRFKAALLEELTKNLKMAGIASPPVRAAFLLGGTFDALLDWSKSWNVAKLPALKSDILAAARGALSPITVPKV